MTESIKLQQEKYGYPDCCFIYFNWNISEQILQLRYREFCFDKLKFHIRRHIGILYYPKVYKKTRMLFCILFPP